MERFKPPTPHLFIFRKSLLLKKVLTKFFNVESIITLFFLVVVTQYNNEIKYPNIEEKMKSHFRRAS